MAGLPETLKQKYFIRRQEEVGQYENWLKEKNFDELRGLGHKLKGNGAMYNYPELSTLGKTIEDSGRDHNYATLESCLISFKEWIKNNQP